jgi:hypothetical protein
METSLFSFPHVRTFRSVLFQIMKSHNSALAGVTNAFFPSPVIGKATGTSRFDFQVNPSTDNNPEKLTDTTSRRTFSTFTLKLIN